MRFSTTTILAIGLLAAVPVTAQNDGTTPKPKQEKTQQPLPTLVRATETLGSTVKTGVQEEAETIGTLDDMIVNTSTGQALFGVVSTGGFLGMDKTLTAVPCDLLLWRQRPGSDTPILVLDTTKQKLGGAPRFDAARLEHCLSDDAWRKETTAAFGSYPKLDKPVKSSEAAVKTDVSATETNAKVSSYRMASKLRGATLRGVNDKIGGVDDLIIDRERHMIAFVVVDDCPLPWNVLSLRDSDLYVAKTKEEFKSAPKLEKDAAARLANPEFCARVKSFYAPSVKN